VIFQAFLDFVRDALLGAVNWGSSLTSGVDMTAAGAAIGGVAAQGGHVLALFVSPSVWGVVVTSFTAYVTVWVGTALIAVIGRRAAGGK
jgi:hypothetical protein